MSCLKNLRRCEKRFISAVRLVYIEGMQGDGDRVKHHLRPFRACNPGILATLACLAPGLAFAATVAESPRPLPRTTCSAGPCFSQSATSEARALPGGIVSPFIAPPGSFTLDDSAARPPGSVAPSGGDFALEGTRDAETPLATEAPAPVGAGVTPAAFDVASRRLETFRADHAALVRAVTGEPATRMNLAEFYLAHAMPPEGLSALEEVSAEGLSREGAARLAALRGALRALDGEDIAGETGFAKNAKEWPDRDLFRAISAARTDGDPVGGADVLDAAVARLDAYPPHFQEDIILDLLELAVVHDHAAAKIALSDRAHATPDLRDSNRLVFLAGMSAAAAGRTDDAVALFQEASRGEGRAAHRATIRLADLGLRRGTPNALRDAVSVLEKARHDWRGDALELELLSRLATGYRALSDMQRAAATLGDIVAGFPETDVAKRADADLREILDALYAAGRAREIPISDLLMFHRQNAISFRHLDGFETYVEHFALTLEAAGMTSAAATEYERARMIVAGASDPDRDRITGLRLKRIAALIEGGQYRTALAEAARIAPADDTVIDERRAELLAAADRKSVV